MIYSYESIRAVHLEITDRCNAACPMCPRYTNGEESPHIQNIQHTLDDIKTMFPIDFVKQLKRINFCGNYGDPIVARDLLPVIAYFKNNNKSIRIEVNTNGSARNVAWWKTLADLMGTDEETSGVWFGLDGVGETNALYRRNTRWDIIMRNAKAFIEAGGVAHWNFIVFKHNEHQIELARALAKEMGFKHFNVKVTGRFGTAAESNDGRFPVIVKGEHMYDLEMPTNQQHLLPEAENRSRPRVNPVSKLSNAMRGAAKVIEKYRREGHLETTGPIATIPKPNISCLAQKESSIFVSVYGYVYPCCWIANAHIRYGSDGEIQMEYDRIDIAKRSIKDIVQGEEFQMIEDSWETGSIHRCVHICTVRDAADGKTPDGSGFMIHRRADEE